MAEINRPRLLTVDEVVERLGLNNKKTLANWRTLGRGPVWVKIGGEIGAAGGQIRYPEDRLDAYIAERTVRPDDPASGEPAVPAGSVEAA